MLKLYRRHTKKCPHRPKGWNYLKCTCPLWADGRLNGKRFLKSLGTRELYRANRKLAKLEEPDRLTPVSVSAAVVAWEGHLEVSESSKLRYRRTLRRLEEFCIERRIDELDELTLADLDRFRWSRPLARTTSARELQILRQFLAYCVERRWIGENLARKIKPPPNPKPREIIPYTPEEVGEILAACNQIGRTNYERRRAWAMVLLMRFTGLRISDVATLAKDRVENGKIMLYTQKTAGQVLLPVPDELTKALALLPVPRGASRDCPYFFWNGVCSRRTVIGRAERTMAAVFRKSGVPAAHAHRFRHTLATEIVSRGGSMEEAADILGVSVKVVEKHYAKWSQARQDRIFGLMRAIQSATSLLQTEKEAVIN